MSKSELLSRVNQSQAKAAFVITTFKGNPGDLQIITPDGSIPYEVRMESAALCREVSPDTKYRINNLVTIAVLADAEEITIKFSQYWASLLGLEISTVESVNELITGSSGHAFALLRNAGGKVHWSFHHAKEGVEIGPRIRILSIRRPGIEQ
ncbi:MAG: hypothetical protein P1Q69_12010 [Candidatus Thorarchaeota archaeon]|nr:hypothetical protein [Candidatus Thorarchaeota archaeon]